MATYAIGDVQGCFETLQVMVRRIAFDPKRDQIYLLGDLVNRGPGSEQVLRWAMEHESVVHAVLGNHELHLFSRALGVTRTKHWDTLDGILSAPDADALVGWLRAQPLARRAGRYLFVHAGLLPQWSAEDALRLAREAEAVLQGPDAPELLARLRDRPGLAWSEALTGMDRLRAIVQAFTRLRTCWADGRPDDEYDGSPEDAPAGQRAWFDFPAPWRRECTVLFGHWSALGVRITPQAIGLDTGVAWGGALSALRLEDRALFSEPVVEVFQVPLRAEG